MKSLLDHIMKPIRILDHNYDVGDKFLLSDVIYTIESIKEGQFSLRNSLSNLSHWYSLNKAPNSWNRLIVPYCDK